jgi:hypothetical protein
MSLLTASQSHLTTRSTPFSDMYFQYMVAYHKLASRSLHPIILSHANLANNSAILIQIVNALYVSCKLRVFQAVHRQVPILIRTIGSSPDLLGIISDPPACSCLLRYVAFYSSIDQSFLRCA